MFNKSPSGAGNTCVFYLYTGPFAFVASQTSFPTKWSGYQEL